MNPIRRLRDLWNREPIDLDAMDRQAFGLTGAPQAPAVDPLMRQVSPLAHAVDTARLDEVAYANRSLCGLPNATTDVLYTCTRPPDHKGIHECRISGPSARLLASWTSATSAVTDTPIYDEAARIEAARRMAGAAMTGGVSRDLAAVAEIGAAANALRDLSDDDFDFALAEILDDGAEYRIDGGEER